jgi:hypothetical protein
LSNRRKLYVVLQQFRGPLNGAYFPSPVSTRLDLHPDHVSVTKLTSSSTSSGYSCSVSKFVGCCTSDPCSQGCPKDDVRPGSFDRNIYGRFSNANCSQADIFYTCTGDGLQGHSPFWGCCLSVPCGDNPTCPDADLLPAILDMDNVAQVEDYRPTGSSTSTDFASSTITAGTTASTTPAAPLTTAAAPSTTATPLVDSPRKSSAAPIAGGVAAGVFLVIIAILAYFCLRKRRARKQQRDEAMHPPSDLPTFMAETPKCGAHDSYGYSKSPPSYASYTLPSGQSNLPHELPAESLSPANKPLGEHRLSELSGETRRAELESPWQSPALQSAGFEDEISAVSPGRQRQPGPTLGTTKEEETGPGKGSG